jgi:hypothetical protein
VQLSLVKALGAERLERDAMIAGVLALIKIERKKINLK